MLAAVDVTFAYGSGPPVLAGLTADFRAGAVTAIIGPNGCGKSTLLRLLLGLLTPQSGRIILDDIDSASASPMPETDFQPSPGGGRARTVASSEDTPRTRAAVGDVTALDRRTRARRLVYLPQASELAFAFTTAQAVALGRYARASAASSHATSESSVLRALDAVGLRARANDPVGVLSAGQRQRVTLARALAQLDVWPAPHPGPTTPAIPIPIIPAPAPPDGMMLPPPATPGAGRYLLADEPVSALDPAHALAALNLLRAVARAGVGVVMVIHDLSLALHAADDVLLLNADGSVNAAGPARTILTPARLAAVFNVPFTALHDADGAVRALIPGLTSAPESALPFPR